MSEHNNYPLSKINVSNSQHPNAFVDAVTSFFVKELYLDMVFICKNDICVQTHKLIMSSVSEFISNIILNCSAEIIYISLPGVDSRIMEILINFLYDGITSVSTEEMASLKELITTLKINLTNLDITPTSHVKVKQQTDHFHQNSVPVDGKENGPENSSSSIVEQNELSNYRPTIPAIHESFPLLGSANTEVFPLQEEPVLPSASPTANENNKIPNISNVIGGLVIKEEVPDYDESTYGNIETHQALNVADFYDVSQSNPLKEPGLELLQQESNSPLCEAPVFKNSHFRDSPIISHCSSMDSSDFYSESQILQEKSNIPANRFVDGVTYSTGGLKIRAVEEPRHENEEQTSISEALVATEDKGEPKKKIIKCQSLDKLFSKQKHLMGGLKEKKYGSEDERERENGNDSSNNATTVFLTKELNISVSREADNSLNSKLTNDTAMKLQLENMNEHALHLKTTDDNFDNGSKICYGNLSIVPISGMDVPVKNVNNDPVSHGAIYTNSPDINVNYGTISVVPLSAMDLFVRNINDNLVNRGDNDSKDNSVTHHGGVYNIPPSVCVKPIDETHEPVADVQSENKHLHDCNVNIGEISSQAEPDVTASTKIKFAKKRRHSSKRTIFSDEDKAILEAAFRKSKILDFETQEVLASQLGVRMKVVENWFTNKKRREHVSSNTSVKHDIDVSTPISLMAIPISERQVVDETVPGPFPFLTNGNIIIKPEDPYMVFNIKETDSFSSLKNGNILIRPENPQIATVETKETDSVSSLNTVSVMIQPESTQMVPGSKETVSSSSTGRQSRRVSRPVTPMEISGIKIVADEKITAVPASSNQRITVRSDILRNALTADEKGPLSSPVHGKDSPTPVNSQDTSDTKSEVIKSTVVGDFKRLYVCDTCQKKFINIRSYNTHSCTEDKPHKCSYCDASFDLGQRLRTHTLIHTNEKPFPCGVCDAKFRRKDHCQSHRRSVHAGEERYECDVCYEKFFTKTNVSDHLAVHF